MPKILTFKPALLILVSVCVSLTLNANALADSENSTTLKENTTSVSPKNVDARIKEIADLSESVVIATVVEVTSQAPDKVTAVRFRIKDILKGPPSGNRFSIQFDKNVPLLDSQWILFFESTVPVNGYLKTVNSDEGHLPATEANTKLIYRILKKDQPPGSHVLRKGKKRRNAQ